MKHIFRRVLRPLLFAAGGAVVGVAYYYTAGCATGACPITASPVTTAIYTAVSCINNKYILSTNFIFTF